MSLAIGIDVAKDKHWVVAFSETGKVLWDSAVSNEGDALEEMLAGIQALDQSRTWGVDLVGGLASLVTTILVAAGETVLYVPGLVVNRARDTQVGGETKSDPRDARVIAEQVRYRPGLRQLAAEEETVAALRVLAARRRVNVLWAMLKRGTVYNRELGIRKAA